MTPDFLSKGRSTKKPAGKQQEERTRIPSPSLKMILETKVTKKVNISYAKRVDKIIDQNTNSHKIN